MAAPRLKGNQNQTEYMMACMADPSMMGYSSNERAVMCHESYQESVKATELRKSLIEKKRALSNHIHQLEQVERYHEEIKKHTEAKKDIYSDTAQELFGRVYRKCRVDGINEDLAGRIASHAVKKLGIDGMKIGAELKAVRSTLRSLMDMDVEKAKAKIGDIHHWKDGDYKKISETEWAKVTPEGETPKEAAPKEKKLSDMTEDEKRIEAIKMIAGSEDFREALERSYGKMKITEVEYEELAKEHFFSDLTASERSDMIKVFEEKKKKKEADEYYSKEPDKPKEDKPEEKKVSADEYEEVTLGDLKKMFKTTPELLDYLDSKGYKEDYKDSSLEPVDFLKTRFVLEPMPEGKTPGEIRLIEAFKKDPRSRLKLKDELKSDETPKEYVKKDFGSRDYWTKDFSDKVNPILSRSTASSKPLDSVISSSFKDSRFKRVFGSTEAIAKGNAKAFVEKADKFVDEHPITYRFHADELHEKLLNSGRTKNLHETGRGHGSTSVEDRSGWEYTLIDYVNRSRGKEELNKFEKSERPSYAMIGAPQAFGEGAGSNYGLSTFTLKEEVKERCTFTIGNSSSRSGSFTRGNARKMVEEDRLNSLSENHATMNRVSRGSTYMGCQIYGQVDLEKDVASVTLSGKEWNRMPGIAKKNWMTMADKYGWVLKKASGYVLYDPKMPKKKDLEDDKRIETMEKAKEVPTGTTKDIPVVDHSGGESVKAPAKKISHHLYIKTAHPSAIEETGAPTTRKKAKIGSYEKRPDGTIWRRMKESGKDEYMRVE